MPGGTVTGGDRDRGCDSFILKATRHSVFCPLLLIYCNKRGADNLLCLVWGARVDRTHPGGSCLSPGAVTSTGMSPHPSRVTSLSGSSSCCFSSVPFPGNTEYLGFNPPAQVVPSVRGGEKVPDPKRWNLWGPASAGTGTGAPRGEGVPSAGFGVHLEGSRAEGQMRGFGGKSCFLPTFPKHPALPGVWGPGHVCPLLAGDISLGTACPMVCSGRSVCTPRRRHFPGTALAPPVGDVSRGRIAKSRKLNTGGNQTK